MKRNVILGGLAAVVVVAVAGWFLFLRDDAPPPVSLEEAVAAAGDQTTTTTPPDAPATSDSPTTTDSPTTSTPADTAAPGTETTLDGTWVVDQSGSFVGYRVAEELASVGFTEAVGRTSQIDATLEFSGTTATTLAVTVDMASVSTGNQFRDGQMRTQALETDQFPIATFTLTSPIELATDPGSGEAFTASATGDLMIHGVTNSVTIDIEGQFVDGNVAVIGSTEVLFSDYDIAQPSAARVLSVEDRGTVEFSLVFNKT